jgi:ABC-type proline/glycine betaine transport system permease subunit
VAVVVCGLGMVLISVGAPEYPLLIPGLIAFGVGGLAMLAAIVVAVIKPDFLARTDDAIKIVKDEAREQDSSPGFSGMKGHKLFHIRGGG